MSMIRIVWMLWALLPAWQPSPVPMTSMRVEGAIDLSEPGALTLYIRLPPRDCEGRDYWEPGCAVGRI